MSDINYKDLGLSKPTDFKNFKWGEQNIEVLKYLPIQDKYDIVMITLQKSLEDGIYNPIKMDMHFHLNLVYIYTNLVFSIEERENEDLIYDEMKSSGFLDAFLKQIDSVEYTEMQEDIDNIAELSMTYKSTAASVMRNFIEDLPNNAEAAQKIVDNFDPAKYQAVVDFAKAANGGKSIK